MAQSTKSQEVGEGLLQQIRADGKANAEFPKRGHALNDNVGAMRVIEEEDVLASQNNLSDQ